MFAPLIRTVHSFKRFSNGLAFGALTMRPAGAKIVLAARLDLVAVNAK
jgi:hypothetical protein